MEVIISRQAKKQLKALERSDQNSHKYYVRVIKLLEQHRSVTDATIHGGLCIMKLKSGTDEYRVKNGMRRVLIRNLGSNRIEVYSLGRRREDSY